MIWNWQTTISQNRLRTYSLKQKQLWIIDNWTLVWLRLEGLKNLTEDILDTTPLLKSFKYHQLQPQIDWSNLVNDEVMGLKLHFYLLIYVKKNCESKNPVQNH